MVSALRWIFRTLSEVGAGCDIFPPLIFLDFSFGQNGKFSCARSGLPCYCAFCCFLLSRYALANLDLRFSGPAGPEKRRMAPGAPSFNIILLARSIFYGLSGIGSRFP